MPIVVPAGTDPELARAALLQPDLDYSDPRVVRAKLSRAFAISRATREAVAADGDLLIQERDLPTRPAAPAIRVRLYERPDRTDPSPALIFFHGGGFVAGDLETEHLRCAGIARQTRVLVISVRYRLAPESPFPAGLEDCYEAVQWAIASAAQLCVDPALVAVGGSSAGANLAAAVSLRARDLGRPLPIFQMLLYPVTDDRMVTTSMRQFTQTPGWNQPNSVHMWRHYLGTQAQAVSPYAAPARASDLVDLPAAYVLTAEFDPLRDEGIEYAARLLNAGVKTELHQFPGTFHGFDAAAPEAAISRRALDEQCAVLSRAVRTTVAGQQADNSRGPACDEPRRLIDRRTTHG